jgi:RHS repeat-associated protein
LTKSINNIFNNQLNYFTAEVVRYCNYLPFGQVMPNRHGNDNQYRYGYQGQERDDEMKGEGNSLNYEFRMHDPRIGRFLSNDPLTKKYPYYSPYAFSGNRILDCIELEGKEPQWIIGWYKLSPTDLDNLTSGHTKENAQQIRIIADKVKQLHDNYVSGVSGIVSFTPQQLNILTGGNEESAIIGNDGVRNVSSFKSLKISDEQIKMYPIKVTGVGTDYGPTDFKGQLKGVTDPMDLKIKQTFTAGTLSLGIMSSKSFNQLQNDGANQAKDFLNKFKENGNGGGLPASNSQIKSLFIQVSLSGYENDNVNAVLKGFTQEIKRTLGSNIEIKTEFYKGDEHCDSISPEIIKK